MFVAQGQMLMTFVVALTVGASFVYAQETILDVILRTDKHAQRGKFT